MNTKILYILLAAFSMVAFPSFAEWNKDEQDSFSRAPEYRYIFDMNGTDYCGMDSVSFIEYNAVKNKMTPEDLAVIVKFTGAGLKGDLLEKTKKKFSENSKSDYVLYVHLDQLCEKAGLKVTVKTYIGSPDNGQTYSFMVPDGRWNKFDILLQENTETLADKIIKKLGLKKKPVK